MGNHRDWQGRERLAKTAQGAARGGDLGDERRDRAGTNRLRIDLERRTELRQNRSLSLLPAEEARRRWFCPPQRLRTRALTEPDLFLPAPDRSLVAVGL